MTLPCKCILSANSLLFNLTPTRRAYMPGLYATVYTHVQNESSHNYNSLVIMLALLSNYNVYLTQNQKDREQTI